jgi:hypothetical protein
MSISFFPSRSNLTKEVDQWIVLKRVDMLMSLCNCCLYKMFDTANECRACRVRSGISRIVARCSREPLEARERVEGEELLGVC